MYREAGTARGPRLLGAGGRAGSALGTARHVQGWGMGRHVTDAADGPLGRRTPASRLPSCGRPGTRGGFERRADVLFWVRRGG